MTQQGWIGVTIVIGFIVFVTIRGDLPAYRAALTVTGGQTQKQAVSNAQQANLPGLANILQGLNQ